MAKVNSFERDLREIYSHYHAAGGISGLGTYLMDDKPPVHVRMWVWISTWIILPQLDNGWMKVTHVFGKGRQYDDIYSHYWAAGGLSGFQFYLQSNDPPDLVTEIWVKLSVWVILPLVTIAHLYTAFFTGIPLPTRFLSMSLGLDQLQITIKSHYILHNLDRFRGIMLDLESFNCVRHLGSKSTAMLLRTCVKVKWLRNAYIFACYFTFIAWTMFPVVSSPEALFFSVDTHSMMKVLPPEYPFSTDYFPMVQLIYGLESLSTFVILTFFSSTNIILVTDILLICQLFEVLNQSISTENRVGEMPLRICMEVKELLSPVLALQLGVSVITITLAVFEITMVSQVPLDSGFDQVVLMCRKSSYTLIIFVELLLFCWLSTELELSCISIRKGVYNSGWYTRYTKNYRDIIIIMMRAIRPVRLDALKIVTLTLGTSLEVLRMAYSYYTYLKRVGQNPSSD